MSNLHSKVLIIGSGPAGCTAAIYCARAQLSPILISGENKGGQLVNTTDVENYPGFENNILGPDLMQKMLNQAEKFDTKIFQTNIVSVDFSKDVFFFTDSNKQNYTADSVIISTGASVRWLGIESEEKYKGFGVSSCAVCDGFFFKEKIVAVVGGGNSAVEEAIFLTKYAKKVILIHRRDSLRADKILQSRLFSNKKIEIIWNTNVVEVLGLDKEGEKFVVGARIENKNTKEIKDIMLDGVFISIGHIPNTKLFKHAIHCDDEGYIITQSDSTKTNVPGVFACGDVQDKIFRQAVTAAGSGCMSAIEVEKFLSSK